MIIQGYNIRRAKEQEHTRMIVYTLCSIYRDPKKEFPTIQRFWPLITDNNKAIEKKEQEDEKRLYEKLQRFKKDKRYKK